MKILFIGGLGRSGTTLLNAFLGKSSSVLALGELVSSRTALKSRLEKSICTCSKTDKSCMFWKNFLIFSAENPQLSFHESLVRFVEINYPEKKIIVDSSKDIHSMLYWVKLQKMIPSIELYPIHIVRDVRGWVFSFYKRKRGLSKLNRLIWATIKCGSWYWRNKQFNTNINSYSDRFIRIGYEEFIFYRAEITSLIFSYCDEPNTILNYDSVEDTNAHELSEFSSSIKNNNKITYDYFWMNNWLSSFLGVFPFIFKLNKKYVYGNMGKKRRIAGSEDY